MNGKGYHLNGWVAIGVGVGSLARTRPEYFRLSYFSLKILIRFSVIFIITLLGTCFADRFHNERILLPLLTRFDIQKFDPEKPFITIIEEKEHLFSRFPERLSLPGFLQHLQTPAGSSRTRCPVSYSF